MIEAMISTNGTSTLGTAQVLITTANGSVTNAAVTLSYSGGSYALGYFYTAAGPVTYNGGVTELSFAYYSAYSCYYMAGSPYTMTVAFGGNTYSASITAVGNATYNTGTSGVTCTWTGPSNEDTFMDFQTSNPSNHSTFGPNSMNPYVIPSSAFSGYTGGSNSYSIDATIVELVTSAFSGAYGGSFFTATDILTFQY
jgi:hypothetical protein